MRLLLATITGALLGLSPAAALAVLGWQAEWVAPLGLLGVVGLSIGGFVAALLRPGPWVEAVAAVAWLGLLPALGFAVDTQVDPCRDPCGAVYQPVAWPQAWWVLGSYGAGLAAFAVGWRRPGPLPAHQEALLLGLMAQAVLTCTLVSVQFGALVMYSWLFPPLASPALVGLTFTVSGLRRLARGGAAGAVGASGLLAVGLGAWGVAAGLTRGVFRPFGGALVDTCGHTFSQLQPPSGDCHYLCTVAAQGHPWLVRPLRLGRRGGKVIVVNRQLAVANAFEDLLHERWPAFGRWARASYDAWGRDVSLWLLRAWRADLVFVAMLPAQALFEVVLLCADPGDPEARIDRMYR